MYLSAPDPQPALASQIKDDQSVVATSERTDSELNEVQSQETSLTLPRKLESSKL